LEKKNGDSTWAFQSMCVLLEIDLRTLKKRGRKKKRKKKPPINSSLPPFSKLAPSQLYLAFFFIKKINKKLFKMKIWAKL
jgi:hypothetical protein